MRGIPPACCWDARDRSEEHTSELQSQSNLVCRLLLEKKKKKRNTTREINTALQLSNPAPTPLADILPPCPFVHTRATQTQPPPATQPHDSMQGPTHYS